MDSKLDFQSSGSTNSLISQSSLSDDPLVAFIEGSATEQSMDAIQELYAPVKQEYNIPDKSTWPEIAQLFTERDKSWKGERLLRTLLQRSSLPEHREYFRDNGDCICKGKRILVVGAGPVGLRFAIEAAFMGAQVDLVEMRDNFSRNNCLHLWPFLVEDLKSLEAKMFYGKFCSGQLDHICIRVVQVILMKICLILGVNIYQQTKFIRYKEPESEKEGWTVECHPHRCEVNFEKYDVILSADGKKYALDFKKKEFRAKLAIGISFNFVNYNTAKENEVSEISGISYTYHQDWFKKLSQEQGIDLENIVYYKDETHYFVMTAKRQSLLKKNVLKRDCGDAAGLTASNNINHKNLEKFAREAARYATDGKMPHYEFSKNHQDQNDVALFDFTSLFASQHASKILKRKGHSLLLMVAGDTLIEPFWPTGSGLARGFLGALDAAWMIRGHVKGYDPMMLLEEREAILQLLSQTTPQRLLKSYGKYSIDPHTRYNLSQEVLLAGDIRHLYDTDDPAEIEKWELSSPALQRKNSRRAHIRKLTGKKQYKIGSPSVDVVSPDATVCTIKRTSSEPALNVAKESPGLFRNPAKFLSNLKQKKKKATPVSPKADKVDKSSFPSIPEEQEQDRDTLPLPATCPLASSSSPEMLPIQDSNSAIDITTVCHKLDDTSSSESSCSEMQTECDKTEVVASSPVLPRPRMRTLYTRDESYGTPKLKRPLTMYDVKDSLAATPQERNASFENLAFSRKDSPALPARKQSNLTVSTNRLTPGFIINQQVTNVLKQILEALVQEAGLEMSRYSLELIIYIFRNCQSHSVDEKYYKIPLISEAFYKHVWQYQTGRQFMIQCQWTIMDDFLLLNLGFDLSKPFQVLERKLDTVNHKLASKSLMCEGRRSKKFNQKEVRFFDKEIYGAIPCLQVIPTDLNASFTEAKSDSILLSPGQQISRMSPPPRRSSNTGTPEAKNSRYLPVYAKGLPIQIRDSPLQILSTPQSVSSPLEVATTFPYKNPPSPPRLPKPFSPTKSSNSNTSSREDSLFESCESNNEVFATPDTSLTEVSSPMHNTAPTTTTAIYQIPPLSTSNATTSTPLIPKSISVTHTPIFSTGLSDSLTLPPDNSNMSNRLTADKIGPVIPPDSFMDVSLPDNSKPIQDIRGNREAEQLVIQQAVTNRQIWKQAERNAKNERRTSSPMGQVIPVMPAKFDIPKLRPCSSGNDPSSPPKKSPPPWADVKLRNTPSNSPTISPKRFVEFEEQPIVNIKDREAEKFLARKTANARQIWLQNECMAAKRLRPGSASSSDEIQAKVVPPPPEKPSRPKWSLGDKPVVSEIIKGSDPMDKQSLVRDEQMLLKMNKTQRITMNI